MTAATTAVDAEPVTIADAWAHVEIALFDHFHEPDVEAARAFYSSLAAHALPGQPVWPMIVAPPGCGKTELINPLHGLPNVHLIDSLTPNTLISGRAAEPGKPKGKDGLLERIGNNATILFSDFSTVLEGNRDKRGEIFSQLRRLYDGRLRREFGIDHGQAVTEWSGRLTFCAAVTPAVDRYASVFGALGERFILIRWKRIGGVDAALTAMQQDHAAKDAQMRAAVHGLFAAMKDAPEPRLSASIRHTIAATAELVALGRTPVLRERDGTVGYVPEAEGATRLAQQLCQLAKGSARLEGRAVVDQTDLRIVHRVAFDTLPPNRAAVLRTLASGRPAEDTGMATTTRHRTLTDLQQLGLLTDPEQTRGRCQFPPEIQTLFIAARLLPN